jgi:hypothetical protein
MATRLTSSSHAAVSAPDRLILADHGHTGTDVPITPAPSTATALVQPHCDHCGRRGFAHGSSSPHEHRFAWPGSTTVWPNTGYHCSTRHSRVCECAVAANDPRSDPKDLGNLSYSVLRSGPHRAAPIHCNRLVWACPRAFHAVSLRWLDDQPHRKEPRRPMVDTFGA